MWYQKSRVKNLIFLNIFETFEGSLNYYRQNSILDMHGSFSSVTLPSKIKNSASFEILLGYRSYVKWKIQKLKLNRCILLQTIKYFKTFSLSGGLSNPKTLKTCPLSNHAWLKSGRSEFWALIAIFCRPNTKL